MSDSSKLSGSGQGGLWRLAVKGEFAAAHSLRHYQGKCEACHGHNFQVEAVVEGRELSPDTELLLDFKILKEKLKEVLEELDHRDLNQTPPFDRSNPSSENLSRHIYKRLALLLATYKVSVHSVTVAERSMQSATYLETRPE